MEKGGTGEGNDNGDSQIPVNSCEYGNFCLPLFAKLIKLKQVYVKRTKLTLV